MPGSELDIVEAESGEADGEEDGEMKSEWLQIRELTGNRRPVLQVA